MWIFIEASVITAQNWRQPKYSNNQQNKLCHVHLMEYYAAKKMEQNPDTYHNLDESQKHYTNESIYIECPEKANL